jgi:hypothetical protein
MRVSRIRALMAVSLCALTLSSSCVSAAGKRQMQFLRQLASELPVYPGFKQASSTERPGSGSGMMMRCYVAQANYDDVKRYYSQLLVSREWRIVGDHEKADLFGMGSPYIVYRKSNYAVFLADNRKIDGSQGTCDFSLTFWWNPPGYD